MLHDQELTYSVIVSEEHPEMPKTVTEAYRVISEGILEGFRELELKYQKKGGSATAFLSLTSLKQM